MLDEVGNGAKNLTFWGASPDPSWNTGGSELEMGTPPKKLDLGVGNELEIVRFWSCNASWKWRVLSTKWEMEVIE